MTESAEISVLSRSVQTESVMAAMKEERSLVEAFGNNFEISQDVKLAESAAPEEKETLEKPDQEYRPQEKEKEGPPDGQEDTQLDRQTVDPPAAESSSTEPKWVVGAPCQAVWSKDGVVYSATVVSLDGDRCRVRFNNYGNHEDMALSELTALDDAPQTQIQNCLKPPLDEEDHGMQPKAMDWKPGSRCRAVYSEDNLVYPAVVLWVKDGRCCVRFDGYENEEEQDVSALLSRRELHGPSIAATAKATTGSRVTAAAEAAKNNMDWKRRRREENQGQNARGETRSAVKGDEQQNFSWLKDKSRNTQSKVEKEAEEKQKDDSQKPPNNIFSFFPPFAPPTPRSMDSVSFIPPSPPLWTFGSSADADPSSSMLMLWYMCGFHTGSYMAQQVFNSKD
ncbi:hypothetical protein PBY51_024917 [Eleginops maclovinus]|uniref:Tudor domain-containing protein n=3 Tax=Eleginops maclovinus TaxID=56733 RepID=A0AAN7Y1Y5_ELEMC|nr:hypothetical protein PBY51_024917 [Eleginops maclovinus]